MISLRQQEQMTRNARNHPGNAYRMDSRSHGGFARTRWQRFKDWLRSTLKKKNPPKKKKHRLSGCDGGDGTQKGDQA
jgi:hypothetical protein